MKPVPGTKRLGCVVVTVAVCVSTACDKASDRLAPPSTVSVVSKVVSDEHGYTPSSITVTKGQPATLEFTRTTDKTCGREVVFPELGITRELPLNVPVRITIPAEASRTLSFQCGMGMYKGSVVVR